MSKNERIKSKRFTGVYWRKLEGKHLGKPDKAFWITWTEKGKKRWLKVGSLRSKCTEELAYQKLTKLLSKLNDGESSDSIIRHNSVTLDQAIQAYFDWRKSESRDTSPDESRYNKHAKPFFNDIQIRDITPELLDKFKAQLLACQAPSSAKKMIGTLRAAINFAIKREQFAGENPISTQRTFFTLPKENNKSERYLTRNEAQALLEELALRSTILHDMAFVSLHTGMRATELFGLKGKDIDIDNKIANIYAKGGDRQQILFEKHDDDVLNILASHITAPDNYLFPSRSGNRKRAISNAFGRAVDALGLNDSGEFFTDKNGRKKPIKIKDSRQKVVFHTFRHTFASWLAQSGKVGIYELMKYLRHKDINMTLRYAHLIPDKQREHLAIVREIMNGPGQ